MDADQVADELYGLLPSQFVAARDDAVARARADGDARAAARIKALRRPTLGAWLADLLVREHPEESRALLELGAGLRAAQDALDGPELRELTAKRRAVVAALSRQARQAATRAGLTVGEGPLQDLEEHLQAVLTDQELADEFATGRLSTTRSPGTARPPSATRSAAPAAAPTPTRTPAPAEARAQARPTAAPPRPDRERLRAEARKRTAEAERDAREAQAAATAARRELDRATARRERLQRQVDDLVERLEQTRDQERQAATDERKARTRVETTDRRARRAQGQARDAAAHQEHLDRKDEKAA